MSAGIVTGDIDGANQMLHQQPLKQFSNTTEHL